MTKISGAIALCLVILIAIAINSYLSISAYDGTHNRAITNCQEIEVLKGALRATLEEADKFSRTSHVRSKLEKKESDEYYINVLARFKAKKC